CRMKSVASSSRSTCASTNTTSPPLAAISAATRLPRSTSRSAKATFAPSFTNRRTVASPIPEAPPVTAATFPLSRAMLDDLPLRAAIAALGTIRQPNVEIQVMVAPRCSASADETAGRKGAERDLWVPSEHEIGDRLPHGRSIEDALAGTAGRHIDV